MKRSACIFCLVFFVSGVASARQAFAQEQSALSQAAVFAQSIPWQGIGMNALERARRSVAIGPFVGLHGIRGTGNDFDGAISFGIGLTRLDVPVIPDRSEIEGVLKERFQAIFIRKFGEALRGDVNGRGVNAKEIARQAWNDVLAAYIKGRKHQRFEKPGLRIHAEGTKVFQDDAWQARLTASLGIGPVAIGIAGGGEFGDDNFGFLGFELTKPVVFGVARTPLLEMFLRVDRGFGDDHDDPKVALGARFLLDVI